MLKQALARDASLACPGQGLQLGPLAAGRLQPPILAALAPDDAVIVGIHGPGAILRHARPRLESDPACPVDGHQAAALGLELPSNDMPAVKEARAWLEVAIEPVVMVVQPYVEAAWQQTTTITHAAGKVVVASTQAVAARWATIAALEAEVASLQEEVTRLRAGC